MVMDSSSSKAFFTKHSFIRDRAGSDTAFAFLKGRSVSGAISGDEAVNLTHAFAFVTGAMIFYGQIEL